MSIASVEELRELRIREVEEAGENQRRRWLVNKAQEMRLSPTPGEAAMYAILEDTEYTWYPQCVAGRYIVDFYCPALNLIVEVDGSSHVGREEHDAKRQNWLQRQGVNGFRTTNKDLMERPWQVAQELTEWIWAVAAKESA